MATAVENGASGKIDRPVKFCKGCGNMRDCACWMSSISILLGHREWAESPKPVAATVQNFCISFQDGMGQKADDIRGKFIAPVFFEPIGTAREGDDGVWFEPQEFATKRRWIAANFALRQSLPVLLRAFYEPELVKLAAELEATPLVVDSDTAVKPREIARVAAQKLRTFAASAAYADAAAAAAYAAADAAAASAAARRLRFAAQSARSGSVVDGVGVGGGGEVTKLEECAARFEAARDRIFQLGMECVKEMCAVDRREISVDKDALDRFYAVCAA